MSGIKDKLGCLGVASGFAVVLFLLILLVDNLIMPAYVHDKEVVDMPELVGMDIEEAKKLLDALNLGWEVNGQQYDPNFSEGEIIIQIPEAGINIKEGRKVLLTISRGEEKSEVPFMVGMRSRDAVVELMSLGLNIGKITYENSEVFDRGIVLEQNVQKGTELTLGSKVNLLVSKGSELSILTPNLVGMSLDEAEAILLEMGLEINVTFKEDPTFADGTIVWQFPMADEETIIGATVDVTVVDSDQNFLNRIFGVSEPDSASSRDREN
ncbi:MAG: hypothetical protein Kapaf2KO_09210 [Candidatus Kapaibacteriales bacterium]